MNSRVIKFRFFCPAANGFVENYNYNGAVDQLFNGEDTTLIHSQYTGEKDDDGNEIWEGDTIQFKKASFPQVFNATIEYASGSFFARVTNPSSTLSMIYLHELQVYAEEIKVSGNIFKKQ